MRLAPRVLEVPPVLYANRNQDARRLARLQDDDLIGFRSAEIPVDEVVAPLVIRRNQAVHSPALLLGPVRIRFDLRQFIKRALQGLSLIAVWPAALTAGFGRFSEIYRFWANFLAMVPGFPGSYVRVAYAHLTLEACSLDCCIEFGSFFAHAQAKVGRHVYIGAYCVLGRAEIGDGTHLASGAQILSGGRQHPRAPDGRLLPSEESAFETIHIGADCWIGAGAIVMADVGERSTIGAGSVVTRPIPSDVVAVGSPARVRENAAV